MGVLVRFATTAAVVLGALAAHAQESKPIDALLVALEVPAVLDIMQIEGARYGATIGEDMLADGGGGLWPKIVAGIYDPVLMLGRVREGFSRELGDKDIALLLAFFQSDVGRKIAGLEIVARRAFLDPAIEETARDNFRALDGTENVLLTQVTDYIQLNDLIEYNVVGALNSNYQFYRGLEAGGAIAMSEETMLSEAWAAEDETRSDTREWMFAYLLMAYQPLEMTEMQAYVDLAKSPQGRALNRALFGGFDAMYSDITYALGRAVAKQMGGQDL